MKTKKRKWIIIVVVVVVLCVAAYFLIPKLSAALSARSAAASQVASLTSAEVTSGEVVTSISATGNIADSDAEVYIPYGVSVDTVYAGAGETVRAGDAIAKVDATSLSSAISTAKSDLAEIDDKLDAISNKTSSSVYVYSNFKGTVSKVYAKAGDDAAKVVAEHGALMTIKLTDGSTYAVTNGEGTVSSVIKKKGDTVYSGTSLFKLSVLTAATSKESLTEKKAELLALIQNLTALQTTKYIYASVSGVVNEVKIADGSALTKTAADTGTAAETAAGDATDGTDAADTDTDNMGVACTITLPDKMKMTVAVDELDITAVKAGQEASIELDAIEGKKFAGKVTKVSDTADTSSGVANFSCTIELDKEDGMLAGMSATATIIKEKKENVLTIPLDAVQQYGNTLFVYTSMASDGTLGDEVQIETGLSDGAITEVTSGLSEGATVYYKQSESASSDNMAFGMQGVGMRDGEPPQQRTAVSDDASQRSGDANPPA